MGLIYAKAVEVIGRLGVSPIIESALRLFINFPTVDDGPPEETLDLIAGSITSIRVAWRELQAHSYWQRAWVRTPCLIGFVALTSSIRRSRKRS